MFRPSALVRCCRRFSTLPQSSHDSPKQSSKNGQRPDSWCQFYDRPAQEPVESTSVLLFPGQGSQFVGMGRNLLGVKGVKELFETASSILRTDLLKTCLEGPADKLSKNIHCQPAVYVTSLAAVKKLQMDSPEVFDILHTIFRLL